MKYVINKCYGGFSANQELLNAMGIYCNRYSDDLRTDPQFIRLLESGLDMSGEFADLEVVDIPNDATDWTLRDYDGVETIIYVKDGKLFFL